jgi:hypothetical protein
MFRPLICALASTFLLGALLVVAVPAHAQTAAAVPPVPLDVQKTLDQVGDLDLLAALTPLNLTGAQIDQLLEPMKAIAREIDAKRKKDYEAVRSLSADVAKARAGMLKGEPLAPDLEARIIKVNADIEKGYLEARQDAVRRLSDALKATLTKQQTGILERHYVKVNKEKIKVPGNLRNSPEKTDEFARNLVMGWYADRILLPERAMGLLTALKAVAPAGPATNAAPAPAATAAAVPPPPPAQ